LIFLCSQLLPHNLANTPCFDFVGKFKFACGAGKKADETTALFDLSSLGNTVRENCKRRRTEMRFVLFANGLSREHTASSQRKHRGCSENYSRADSSARKS